MLYCWPSGEGSQSQPGAPKRLPEPRHGWFFRSSDTGRKVPVAIEVLGEADFFSTIAGGMSPVSCGSMANWFRLLIGKKGKCDTKINMSMERPPVGQLRYGVIDLSIQLPSAGIL